MHLSAGDLLREERNTPGSAFGELIENHIRNGTIVPVEITCSLLATVGLYTIYILYKLCFSTSVFFSLLSGYEKEWTDEILN